MFFVVSCNQKTNLSDGTLMATNDEEKLEKEILKNQVHVNLGRYRSKICPSDTFHVNKYVELFSGFKNLGDINNDGKDDSVFILEPLTRCEEGQSYYFSDPGVERIPTESMCCHLYSIHNLGDINEDGYSEVAEYYSSCASRYKAITVYSLRKTKWLEIISFSYVLNDKYDIEKDLKNLFRKKSNNILEYLEIEDVTVNGKLVLNWKEVQIN